MNLKFAPKLQNEFDVLRWRRAEKAASYLLLGLAAGCLAGLWLVGLFVGGA